MNLNTRNNFFTDHSKAVVLMWLSVTCFGFRISVIFHLLLFHYTFSSVKVIRAHCILFICILSGFKSRIWFLIAPVPVHYYSITFHNMVGHIMQFWIQIPKILTTFNDKFGNVSQNYIQ